MKHALPKPYKIPRLHRFFIILFKNKSLFFSFRIELISVVGQLRAWCMGALIVDPRSLTPADNPQEGEFAIPMKPTTSSYLLDISSHLCFSFSYTSSFPAKPFISPFIARNLIAFLGVPNNSFSGHTGISSNPLDSAQC